MKKVNDTDGPARERGGKRAQSAATGELFRGFANWELPRDQAPALDAYASTDAPWEDLHETVSRGYRFSLKWDEKTRSFLCAVSMLEAAHPDAGIVYTERSSTPIRALLKALYGLERAGLAGQLSDHLAGGSRETW